MTQQELVDHLKDTCGCIVVRIDAKGYYVMRNVINAKMCGVPVASNNGQLKAASVCHICRILSVEIPEEAQKAIEVIDHIHKSYPKPGNK